MRLNRASVSRAESLGLLSSAVSIATRGPVCDALEIRRPIGVNILISHPEYICPLSFSAAENNQLLDDLILSYRVTLSMAREGSGAARGGGESGSRTAKFYEWGSRFGVCLALHKEALSLKDDPPGTAQSN